MATASDREDVETAGRRIAQSLADLAPWLRGWGFVPLQLPADGFDDAERETLTADEGSYRCPDMESHILNAHRVRESRQALLDTGSLSTRDIARGRGCSLNTVQRQIQRSRRRNELVAVAVSGELRVPAVLLDDAFDVRTVWRPVIAVLREARLNDWAVWRWIARPNAGLSGRIAADLIETDAEHVYGAARRRMIQATS